MGALVIFGAGEFAEVAKFYFEEQKEFEVVAFVVDDELKETDQFSGVPLLGVSELQGRFPADKHSAFAAIGYTRMNKVRESKYKLLKNMGYPIATYLSPYCNCFTNEIGENCFILEANTLQPFVRIGNNVAMWSGNHIGHHSVIGDNCFISSHVVVSGGVTVERNCFIGVNATIRDHIRIGEETLIGAGALVTKDTKPRQVLTAPAAELVAITSDKVDQARQLSQRSKKT